MRHESNATIAATCSGLLANDSTLPVISLAGVVLFPGVAHLAQQFTPAVVHQFQNVGQCGRKMIFLPPLESDRPTQMGCLVEMDSYGLGTHDRAVTILRGIERVQIVEIDQSLETAHFEAMEERYDSSANSQRSSRRKQLLESFYACFPILRQNQLLIPHLQCDLPFSALCDLLASTCQLTTEEYCALLHEVNVDRRCDLMIALLKAGRLSGSHDYPASFSWN